MKPERLLARGEGRWTVDPPGMSSAWRSESGHRRVRNEDRAGVGQRFVVVADGIGSVPGSGATAEVAVSQFAALVAGATSERDVVAAVQGTHDRVLDLVRQRRLPDGTATTLVAAVHLGDDVLVVVNVGDSPAWLLTPQGPRLLAQLHRRWDPLRRSFALLSAIGSGTVLEPSVCKLKVGSGLRVVLASDGVFDDPAEVEPPAALQGAQCGDVRVACGRIVDTVLAGPARDNITVAVLDVGNFRPLDAPPERRPVPENASPPQGAAEPAPLSSVPLPVPVGPTLPMPVGPTVPVPTAPPPRASGGGDANPPEPKWAGLRRGGPSALGRLVVPLAILIGVILIIAVFVVAWRNQHPAGNGTPGPSPAASLATLDSRVVPLEELHGDTAGITNAAFSPDAATLVTAGAAVWRWDVASGAAMGERLPGSVGAVTSVALTPDGGRLATGGDDGQVRLWEVGGATVKQLSSVLVRGKVTSVAFSPDGGRLATGGDDGQVRLWDVETRREVTRVSVGGGVLSLAFTPDERKARVSVRAAAGGTMTAGRPPITLWEIAWA